MSNTGEDKPWVRHELNKHVITNSYKKLQGM